MFVKIDSVIMLDRVLNASLFLKLSAQSVITCSKLTIETLE